MEWNFKAPSWDMMSSSVVDEEATLPNIETTMEDDESSARFGVYYRTKGNDDDEFSVDLKLGHVGNYHFGSDHIVPNNNNNNNINNNNKSKVVGASSGVSKIASSSPYKRARASNNGTLRVSCLVDGCNSDLSTCRDYHRRHKVCEQHSKTPEVTIAGLKQRFCQQCSRFHSLEQFDEGKRSCRKRLDGHNRRRRKPQPEPLTRPGTFLSNYQGSQMLPLSSSSHSYSPSAMAMSPGWSSGGLVNSSSSDSSRLQHHHHHHQQDFFHGSSPAASSSYNKEENKHQVAAAASSSFLHSNSNATPIFNNNKMLFYDSNLVATSSVHDVGPPPPPPPRALSLLSPPSPSPSSSSQTHHHRSMCVMQQPLGLSLLRDDDNNSNSFESVDRVLAVPNNNNNNNNSNGSSSDHHCCPSPSLYYSYDNHNIGGSDGSHGNEAHHQFFPFQWE